MEVLAPKTRPAQDELTEYLTLVTSIESATGAPQLSDQSRLALERAAADHVGSNIGSHTGRAGDRRLAIVPVREGAVLVGFVQVSPSSPASGDGSHPAAGTGWTLDVVSDPEHPIDGSTLDDLVRAGLGALHDVLAGELHGDGRHDPEADGAATHRVTWWRDGTADGNVESALGFVLDRELLQMRRSLPTGLPVAISTRSFVPGADEQAFLTVNNRAFANHHEQSGWTVDMVLDRERADWFDPDGFRLHERDGRLAGFCWTKVHPADERHLPLGEIYVIAVDPDFAGHGLGAQLTLAGLDHLARIGIETAMLYVDADNTSAVSMYRRLGFDVESSTKAFSHQLTIVEATDHHDTPA